jgi:hypothetical protein
MQMEEIKTIGLTAKKPGPSKQALEKSDVGQHKIFTSAHAHEGMDKNSVRMMQPGLMKPSMSDGRWESHSSI